MDSLKGRTELDVGNAIVWLDGYSRRVVGIRKSEVRDVYQKMEKITAASLTNSNADHVLLRRAFS